MVICRNMNKAAGFKYNENGYIVVETIGTFVPFILLVVSILSLINIVALQARMHYALTQAANTLSMYCYTLEVLGVANDLTSLDNKAYRVAGEVDAMKSEIRNVITGIESFSDLSGAMDSGGSAVNRAFGWAEAAAGDPKAAMQLIMDYGADEAWDMLFEFLARPLVGRYLSNGALTGDEYLKRSNVVKTSNSGEIVKTGLMALEFYQFTNMGLHNSKLIDKNGNVKLVAEYEVEYTFGGLRLPFRPTLRITQTVVTKAWLNGSGKGYW